MEKGKVTAKLNSVEVSAVVNWSVNDDSLSGDDRIRLHEVGQPDSEFVTMWPATGSQTGSTTVYLLSYVLAGKDYEFQYYHAKKDAVLATSTSFQRPKSAVGKYAGCPTPNGSLKCFFDPSIQKLTVEWSFADASEIHGMGLLYVHEDNESSNFPITFSHSLQGITAKGSLDFAPTGPISNGKKYYAKFMGGKSVQKPLASSDPFEIRGLKPRDDYYGCEVTAKCESITENSEKQIQLTVNWKIINEIFEPNAMNQLYFTEYNITDTKFKDIQWTSTTTYGQASGKKTGSLKLLLGGLVKPKTKYVIHYVDQSSTPSISLGHCEPFEIDESLIPNLSEEEQEKLSEKSKRHNVNSSFQHTVTEAKEKLDFTYNPLLTIVPESNTFLKKVQNSDKQDNTAAATTEAAPAPAAAVVATPAATPAPAPTGPKPDNEGVLEHDEFFSEVLSKFNNQQGFIYAGAGVSMDAPSSSPSWWALMNELLYETFKSAPNELGDLASKLASKDNTRQPEEIMESYYFVFQDRLFTLFQLLEAGSPNSNHIAIAKLAKANKIKAILTTNFDIFIERALRAEGIEFDVIVTDNEFREYHENGCSKFAVLKIHGTIDRPSTIVAVANHYKMGKGFAGYKLSVLAHFLKNYPTLFLGYSGWDFEHSNYQEFWRTVGEEGGENVYWLTLKGFGGGPNLRKILGTHIGKRLVIGASYLPQFIVTVVEKYDQTGSKQITEFHKNLDVEKLKKQVVDNRKLFLEDWVRKLPKVQLLSLISLEGQALNQKSQESQKKLKQLKETDSATFDQAAMTAYMTQIASDFGSGKITMEEYMEKIEMISLDATFAHIKLPKAKKDELKLLYLRTVKSDEIYLNGPDAQLLKQMTISALFYSTDRLELDSPVQLALDLVLNYFKEKVIPLSNKTDKASLMRKEIYLYLPVIIKCSPEEAKEADKCIDKFVEEAISKDWDTTAITIKRNTELGKQLNIIAYGQIDSDLLHSLQIKEALSQFSTKKSELAPFLDSALCIALNLYREAIYIGGKLLGNPKFQQYFSLVLHSNPNAEISSDIFTQIEDECFEPYKLLIEKVSEAQKYFGNTTTTTTNEAESSTTTTPAEILATFEVAKISAWEHGLRSFGVKRTDFNGFFPTESLPTTAVHQFLPRVEKIKKLIKDGRVAQSIFALMVAFGQSKNDINVIRTATLESLEVTQGKVTELTPESIPEIYALALQESNQLQESLKYYRMALDGVKTCVVRTKIDAIVLQACLVQSKFSVETALKWTFTYSPAFGALQRYVSASPSRFILLQQAEKWAKDLGFASLQAAQSGLMSKAE
eukprot:c20454_g1_i1.p1 GENE.c20454_g1_i1~~c20454_g1_i1.p1  ORF type:complete len:1321 (-),score=657.22 c20454_g1_i1:126-4067(-)